MANEAEKNGGRKPKPKETESPWGALLDPQSLAAGIAGGVKNMTLTPSERIASLLEDTSVEMTVSTSGFVYGEDELPHWVPDRLASLLNKHPVAAQNSGYDPYTGVPGAGDERVYIGNTRVPVEMTGQELREGSPRRGADPTDYSTTTKSGGMQKGGLTPSEARAAGLDHNDTAGSTRKADDTLSAEQAKNLPYAWSEDEVLSAMEKFRKAGFNVTTFDQLKSVWDGLVERASMIYSTSKGQRKITPWDVLEMSRKEAKAAGTLTNFENGTRTITNTSVTEISEGQAWEVLRSTLQTLLGRDPSDRELRDYAYRMNSLAAKNPSVTETIQKYKKGEVVSQASSTTGGFDAADMAHEAYEDTKDDPEYAKVQAGTTYYNALLQAIGAVGEI